MTFERGLIAMRRVLEEYAWHVDDAVAVARGISASEGYVLSERDAMAALRHMVDTGEAAYNRSMLVVGASWHKKQNDRNF